MLSEDLARREVDEPLDRVASSRSAASSTLYVPITLTRIVRTGLSSTVSTPAIAAQWTTCVAPLTTSARISGVEDVALDEPEVRVLGEARAAERVAVEVVDGDDLVVVDEPPRERRPDEARAARDDDALSAQGHAGECRRPRLLLRFQAGGEHACVRSWRRC